MGPTSSETLGISSCNARTQSARYSFDTNFGCSPATSRMLRKPCALSARASRRTSSTVSVTRRMGLSREKPQYLQLLMHSLETYSGAKSRMTLPNRCCVSACERRPSGSNNSPAAGEISSAKSAGVSRDLASASRTLAVVADKERFSKASDGSALNSATKLMELPYQKR